MRDRTHQRRHSAVSAREGLVMAAVVALFSVAVEPAVGAAGTDDLAGRVVTFHGVQVTVPLTWRVVDLTTKPHACIRLDRPSLYVGAVGDQAACPARLIGGAPVMELDLLTAGSVNSLDGPLLEVASIPALGDLALPSVGPVSVAIPSAGLLATLRYGPDAAGVMRGILQGSAEVPGAHEEATQVTQQDLAEGDTGFSVPGDYRGLGFDACTAPSQDVMDSWRQSSPYDSIGIYVGGVSMGCDQPNLTAAWVSRQVELGWHLVPVYVGRQAPCSDYRQRISYNVATARAQGEAEAADAAQRAGMRGIVAPSTLYADMEGYDSSDPRCVAAVMSYVSGWTFALHTKAYQAGVYSSASSGMHDLVLNYDSLGPSRPDDLFMAWWNHEADVDGGSYVPPSKWRYQQRVHQYEGNRTEQYGGHAINIDRNYLDVSTVVQRPDGCPTNMDFRSYPFLRWPTHGEEVRAAQCLLALNGFDPGPATGVLNWRTSAAIRAFKASSGLDGSNPSIGQYAWTALLSAGQTRFLDKGAAGPYVRKAQRTLTARLQTTVPINGVFDSRMRHVVRRYQRIIDLRVTGTIGQPTWHALQAGR